MAQATILAAGQTAATSSDLVLAAGASATVGIFATGRIPSGVELSVFLDTPGDDQFIARLTEQDSATSIMGPGTYRVKRPDVSAYGLGVGAFTET